MFSLLPQLLVHHLHLMINYFPLPSLYQLSFYVCVCFSPHHSLSFSSPYSIISSPLPLVFHLEGQVYSPVIFIGMRHIYTVYFDREWETYVFLELCCTLHHISWPFNALESSDIDPGSASLFGSILFTILSTGFLSKHWGQPGTGFAWLSWLLALGRCWVLEKDESRAEYYNKEIS